MSAKGVASRKNAQSLAIVRIDADCFLQKSLSSYVVLPRDAPIVGKRTHDEVPCVHIVWCLATSAEVLCSVELGLDCGDDRLRDFILHREYVSKVAVVALRPQMAARHDVVQLGGYAYALALLAHTTFDDVTNAELVTDLASVNRSAL